MALITKRFKFDAAHYLPNYIGKCANHHGHCWTVEVSIYGHIREAPNSQDDGFVVDFTELNKFLKSLSDRMLDHQDLNDSNHIPLLWRRPTAELIARWIFKATKVWVEQQTSRLSVKRVRLWETEDSSVEIVEEDIGLW